MTDITPRVFQTSGRVWLKDFEFGLTGLTVRKTGARVPYSPSVIKQVSAWFSYFFAAQRIERATPSFTIAFAPERARPWYLIWAVARAAGAKYTKDIATADVVMHFEDATYSPNEAPTKLKPGVKLVNFTCRDVSKTNVSRASGIAFGRALAVDPTTYFGPAVEKSEINAAHDGRIVQCPTQPIPGRVYQRVIDNRIAGHADLVEDLRTCTVGGKPVCVFLKRRQVTKRFLNTNTEVLLRRPEEVFTPAEIDQIGAFTREIGLQWGGVDVLRDKDGSLHIVDANKTDMGPPIGLNLPDKIVATRMLAKAFRAFVRCEAA